MRRLVDPLRVGPRAGPIAPAPIRRPADITVPASPGAFPPSELGSQEISETIDVTFAVDPKKTSQAAPHLFKGNVYTDIKVAGLPFGNVTWDVTGVKK